MKISESEKIRINNIKWDKPITCDICKKVKGSPRYYSQFDHRLSVLLPNDNVCLDCIKEMFGGYKR